MPKASRGRGCPQENQQGCDDLLLPWVSALSRQFPEAFGALKVQPLPPQSPSPARYIHTPLGQHLSIQGKQLPFCSALGTKQVKGVPGAPPPTSPVPMGPG